MESPDARAHPSDGGAPLVDDSTGVATLRRRLLAFFDARARDLPWRRTDDPYAIWVSEIMLQQTRVDTVVPYFERWLERFPDVEALAGAVQDEVLKAWEGLGYYRRARMLHRAAGMVRDRFDGRLPTDAEGLRELPGVGEYTSGAVASIAFGEAVPAVDGNVRRVLARLYDLPDPTPAELRERAAGLVDPERPGDFNQALMELGATVCTPRSPDCPDCPVGDLCAARAAGTQEVRPAPKERAPVPERCYEVAVLLRPGRGEGPGPEVLVRRRPADGLLGGLWELPNVRVDGAAADTEDAAPSAAKQVAALPEVVHTYSHFRGRYRARVFRAEGEGVAEPDAEATRWIPVAGPTPDDTPMPVAMQAVLRHLREHPDDLLSTAPDGDPTPP